MKRLAILDEGTLLFIGKIDEMIKQTEGRICVVDIPIKELDSIRQNFIVTNVVMNRNIAHVKYIDNQNGHVVQEKTVIEATAEDAYMYLTNSSRGDEGNHEFTDKRM